MSEYTVGRVADLAGVTVRTLHHYDGIGLVRPSGRTVAGYRVYRAPDIDRLQRDGIPAGSAAGRALAEKHRQYLDRWFYDCSHERHRDLADMYVFDPQFRQTFDGVQPGLADYLHDAILANADARG